MTKAIWAAAMLCAIATPALADDRLDKGWYMGGQIGWLGAQDSDSSILGEDVDTDYDIGYAIGLTGGYDFGQNFRAEAEWTFRSYDVDSISVLGEDFKGQGNADLNVLMVNGYFDLPFRNMRFVPYVGGGIGLGILSADDVGAGGVKLLDDTEAVFTYQVMAGLSYDITDNVTAGVEYRFVDTTDAFSDTIDSTTHNMLFNIRYRFP